MAPEVAPFPFLDLLAELRLEVYAYTLSGAYIELHICDRCRGICDRQTRKSAEESRSSLSYHLVSTPSVAAFTPALARISKFVYQEANPVLWQECTFCVAVREEGALCSPLLAWLDQIPAHALDNVRKLN
ncbi:hypothetical protein LTS18_007172, partial [Coniosporium uncinatum]